MTTSVLPQDLPKPLAGRMEALIAAIQPTYPETIQIAFASRVRGVSDDATAERRFQSLWLFTDHYLGEIRNPLAGELRLNYDITPLAHIVDYIRLTSQAYDFQTATTESELSLEFTTSEGLSGTITAVGIGCDDLLLIYKDRFRDNLVKVQRVES